MSVNSPEPTLYSVIFSCVCFSTIFDEDVNDIIVFKEQKVNAGLPPNQTMAKRRQQSRLRGTPRNTGPAVTAIPVPLTTPQCYTYRPGVKCVQANAFRYVCKTWDLFWFADSPRPGTGVSPRADQECTDRTPGEYRGGKSIRGTSHS